MAFYFEMTSTYERFRKCVESLGKIIERLRISRDNRSCFKNASNNIINGNGNLSQYGHEPGE